MPAPIVVGQRVPQWQNMLMQLYMTKFTHNLQMEQQEARREDLKAEAQASRDFQMEQTKKKRQGELAEKGFTLTDTAKDSVYMPVAEQWYKKPEDQVVDIGNNMVGIYRNGKLTNIRNKTQGAYKEGEIKDFKEGNQFIQKKYANGQWVPTGKTAPRYKPTTNIYNQMSIGERQRQQDIADINSPKFQSSVTKDVKQLNSFEWDLWGEGERENAIRSEADKRVRITYPNATFGVQDGKMGWYIKEGNKYKLVAPWSE